jgi:hypothetical protein
LERPITVSLAVKGPGIAATVKEQAQLTIELHLSAGPLRLRNVKWLVTDNDMDEVLLDRPLLKAVGIDAPSHLEAVRDDYQDLDCSKIASAHAGGKLSRILIERDANPTFFLSPEGDKQDPSTHTQGLDYGRNQIVSTGEVTRNEHQHGLETCADVPITGVRASALNVPDSVTHGDADSDPIDVPQ